MKKSLRAIPILALVFSMGCGDDFAAMQDQPAAAKAAFEILPADAEMVGSVNFENSALADRMGEIPDLGTGEAQARLEDFLEMTGFDPTTDIDRAYVAINEDEKSGSIVLYADVDQDRMESYIDSEMGNDLSKMTIDGMTVYKANHDSQDGNSAYFSVVNDEMMIASFSQNGIEGMIDRVNNGGTSLASNSELMSLIDRVQYPEGAWGVAMNLDLKNEDGFKHKNSNTAEHQQMFDMVKAMGMVDDVVFSADISDINDIEFVVDAGVAGDMSASDVSSLVKGAVSAAKISAGDSAEAMEMLDGVRVSDTNGRVIIRGELPQSLAAQMN